MAGYNVDHRFDGLVAYLLGHYSQGSMAFLCSNSLACACLVCFYHVCDYVCLVSPVLFFFNSLRLFRVLLPF